MMWGAVLVAVIAAAAGADPKDIEAAQRHEEKAHAHFQGGRFAEAIREFEDAYRVGLAPSNLLNAAIAYDLWPGHCKETLAAFERFGTVCKGCDLEKKASAILERTKERCMADLTVKTEPSGAMVTIDGREIGRSPVTARVPIGKHAIGASLEGYVSAAKDAEIDQPEPRTFALSLVRAEKKAEAEPRAVEPDVAAEPPAPPRRTTALKPPTTVVTNTEPSIWPSAWPSFVWISGGGAVAAATVGAIFLGLAESKWSAIGDYYDKPVTTKGGPDRLKALGSDFTRDRNASIVAFAVSAASAGAAVVSFLIARSQSDESYELRATALEKVDFAVRF